jgi:FlaA1/EpsC-like NDP-sugar epimerase
MSSQNFKNHGRYIFFYHIVTSVAILLVLVGSIITFVHSDGNLRHASIMLILISLILGSLFWYSRVFALKAQDRAIRSEENLRHFILTGKPLDSRLRISQIIALRFASDEEFVDLAKRSAEENLKQTEIKKAINNWKADHHRV